MDESMVMVCMQIITNTGSAKSSYIEAIQKAKKGNLGGAEISMNEGDDLYAQAHEVHTSLIQKEASGEKTEFSLILMHAEDQMASTEMAKARDWEKNWPLYQMEDFPAQPADWLSDM